MAVRTLIEVDAVAERLGQTPHAVYRMAREGILPHVRLGRKVRVDPEVLEEWIRGGGQALPGGWRRDADDGGQAAR